MSSAHTKGIHHITAITADPQKNLDFYEGLLGQKLVKRTVNFDDPSAYHLYYGDDIGTPGTLMTFFFWKNIPQGKRGSGEVESIYYTIKPASLPYWKNRCTEFDINYIETKLPFGETVLLINDPDGLKIGLVASEVETNIVPWSEGPVPIEHVLGGFYGALLSLHEQGSIKPVLEEGLGYTIVDTKDTVTRYQASTWPGKFLATTTNKDVPPAIQGAGSIHHIAFQADNDSVREALEFQVNELGVASTGLIDRHYFHATYFMTPAAILFELSTNDIGVTIDEPAAELGTHLIIPAQHEIHRDAIIASLTPLQLPRDHVTN